jgi:acetylornithine deacetylase/succinyl-diaminopimelate desuccinylase-like protein
VDGKLYGRGSTDDKGPVLGWIHSLQVTCYWLSAPISLSSLFSPLLSRRIS